MLGKWNHDCLITQGMAGNYLDLPSIAIIVKPVAKRVDGLSNILLGWLPRAGQ